MADLENKEIEEETEECIDWDETQKQGKIVKTTRKKEKKEVVDYDLFIPGEYNSSNKSKKEDTTVEKFLYEEFESSFFSKLMDGLVLLSFVFYAIFKIYFSMAESKTISMVTMLCTISVMLLISVSTTTAIRLGIWPKREDNKMKLAERVMLVTAIIVLVFSLSFLYEEKIRKIMLIICGAHILYMILVIIITKIVSKNLTIKKG